MTGRRMTGSQLILLALGVLPVYLLTNASLSTSVTVTLTYLLGWSVYGAARRRDPEEKVPHEFARSAHGKCTLFSAALLAQWLALALTGRKALVAILVFFVCFLCLWATARSAESLHQNVTRAQLVFVATILCFIALELGLLVISATRPRNGLTMTWGHEIQPNALGFRERAFESPKPTGMFRVMVAGDSLTWGAGLPVEKRYSNLLEDQLELMFPDVAIEVLNFGLRGASTVRERDVLRTHIDDVDPDLVVVGFCINDPQQESQSYAVELERFRRLFETLHDLGKVGLPRTSGFLRDRLDRGLRNVGLVPSWPEALDRTYVENSTAWRDFEAAIEDIKSMSDARGLPAPIFVPLLQGSGDFNHPDAFLEHVLKWSRQAASAARREGFTVVSLEKAFRSQGHRDRSVNSWDDHPSAECNEIYARSISMAVAPMIRVTPQVAHDSATWPGTDATDE